MSATGAETGSNLVPAGAVISTTEDDDAARSTGIGPADPATGALVPAIGKPVDDRTTRSPRQLFRAAAAVIVAVLVGAAAWLLLRHGVRTDGFPPFLADTTSTPITRYSGPWITAAAGAALLAALLLMSALLDVIRWSRAVPMVAE